MLAADLAAALDPSLLMTRCGFPPDPWQRNLLRSDAKRLILLCSRQAGKSTVTAIMALHAALYQAPALVLLLSPSQRQSTELFRKVTDAYLVLGQPVDAEASTVLRLELANGSRIVALPGSEATVRGFSGVSLLVVDEAARVDDALYYSVRPMLAVSGGRLVALSTPFGKRGWFYEVWQNGDGWQRVRVTAEQCPRITPEFLAEERAAMGDWWYRQEYGCEFVETADQLFSYDLVRSALSNAVAPLFAPTGALSGGDLWLTPS